MKIPLHLQRFVRPAIIVTILLSILYGVYHSGWKEDLHKLPPPNLAWLTLATVMFVGHYLVQGVAVFMLMRALGQRVTVRQGMELYFIGVLARWMPGRFWYTGARLIRAKQMGISVTATGFASVLELVYNLLGGIIIVVLFAASVLHGIKISANGQHGLYVAGAIIIIAATMAIRPATLVALGKMPLFRKTMRKVAGEELTDDNQPSMTTASGLLLILYYTAFWLYSGLAFGVLAKAFVPMNTANWLACIPAFAGSWLIGFFSIFTPAGLGVREGAMVLMLQNTTGIAPAVVLSIASRLMMFALELFLTPVVLLILKVNTKMEPPMPSAVNPESDDPSIEMAEAGASS